MTRKYLFSVAAAVATLGLIGTFVACVGDDPGPPAATPDAAAEGSTIPTTPTPTPTTTTTGTTPPPALAVNGTVCSDAKACASGFCVDGVCCDTACTGTCERCNLPGKVGTCEAIPDGQDPDTECGPEPLPDAGAPAPSDAGSSDGGKDGGAEGGTGGPPPSDGGLVFAVPDGGLPPTDPSQCTGRCDGKRACAYKGTETTCGETFCGNKKQQGRATCDGKGHCIYGVEQCSAYSCPDGSKGCKTTCLGPADCLPTHYCDGPTTTCKPKFANATTCTKGIECLSGYCFKDTPAAPDGVCCNSDCTGIVGGTCTKPGSEGKCSCSACATGPCDIFYRDEDGDGYGDMNGTIANNRAKYGCVGTPPAGYVADKTDCLDSAAAVAKNVHPNQPNGFYDGSYLSTAGTQSFDYDCSGSIEKETTEYGCGFCKNQVIIIVPFAPGAAPAPTFPYQSLKPDYGFCYFQTFVNTCSTAGSTAGHYCDCGPQNYATFIYQTDCGKTGTLYTCDACTVDGGTSHPTSTGSRPQRCH